MILIHKDEFKHFDFIRSAFLEDGSWDGDQHGGAVTLPDGRHGTYMYFTHKDDYMPFREARKRILAQNGLYER